MQIFSIESVEKALTGEFAYSSEHPLFRSPRWYFCDSAELRLHMGRLILLVVNGLINNIDATRIRYYFSLEYALKWPKYLAIRFYLSRNYVAIRLGLSKNRLLFDLWVPLLLTRIMLHDLDSWFAMKNHYYFNLKLVVFVYQYLPVFHIFY